MEFTPNEYQINIYDFVENKKGNGVIKAPAGSGKTSTIFGSFYHVPIDAKVLYLVFNKHNEVHAQRKLQESDLKNKDRFTIKTFHSFGLSSFRRSGIRHQVEKGRSYVMGFIYDLTENEKYSKELKIFRETLRKTISLSKATLVDYTNIGALLQMAEKYSIDTNGNYERIVNLLPSIMEKCKEHYIIDFDDMIWKPVIHKYNVEKFDYIFVDEMQDANKARTELVSLACKVNSKTTAIIPAKDSISVYCLDAPNFDYTRVIAVGDEKQSIYGFTGADLKAMQNFTDRFNAVVLPLPITYRCPKSHVDFVVNKFPDYPFIAAPNAIEGTIETIEEKEVFNLMSDGDMGICRLNAPLIQYAFTLIRQGKKAIVRGRDIGQNLVNLIEKLKAQTIPQLYEKLAEYETKETTKYVARKNETGLQSLQDKCDTIELLASEVNSIPELIGKIETIFSDDIKGIVLSSVHKAKGLEADRIFIIEPENMPLPRVLKSGDIEQIEQENNIWVVAHTRSKRDMFIVKTDSNKKQKRR